MTLDQAEACPTSRRDVAALAQQLPDDVIDLLAQALSSRRASAFTHLLLASLHAGREIDATLIAVGAGLLPGAETLASVAGRLRGDVGGALIAAVRGRRLGADREPAALLVAELWARRAGVERPDGLLAEARIRARRQLTQEGEDALVALHGLVDDPDLGTLVADLSTPDVKEAARAFASRLVERLVGEPLSGLPERPQRQARSRGPVRRAVQKVGRNDPCPCGSGKKYKLCHEANDRDRLAESSEIAGLTATELKADLEAHLTEERLLALRGHELVGLDPARVPRDLVGLFADQLALWGEFDASIAALVARWSDDLDEIGRIVAEQAARAGRADVVRRIAELRAAGAEGLVLEARLAIAASDAERLALIEADARAELDTRGVDLGLGLLAAGFPALGIHVARSQLALRPRDPLADSLEYALLEARDALLLPPWDAIDDILYKLDRGVDRRVDAELAQARARVDQSEARLNATHEALERLREELVRREAEAPAPAVAPAPAQPAPASVVDDVVVRELRERLERMKGELKERHRERNALRRDLEATKERMAELVTAADADAPGGEEDEEDEAVDVEIDVTAAARVRVPVFPEDFAERLRDVPDATARAAMARVGELCAGYEHAFREVRPLRGFEGTWRVKVGRSYRLLFHPGEDTLEVIDLVHRQQLEKRLFRLRRGGE